MRPYLFQGLWKSWRSQPLYLNLMQQLKALLNVSDCMLRIFPLRLLQVFECASTGLLGTDAYCMV